MTMTSAMIDKYQLLSFYRRQLKKFRNLDIGGMTENKVLVTNILINATERRLNQLKIMKGDVKYGIRHQYYANTNN